MNFGRKKSSANKTPILQSPHSHVLADISVVLFNARSIVGKLHTLRMFIQTFSPHVLAITETWTHDDITDNFLSQEGYCLFRQDRKGRIGGGAILLVKSSLKPVPFDFPYDDLAINNFSFCFVNYGKSRLLLSCIYRSPISTPEQDARLAQK